MALGRLISVSTRIHLIHLLGVNTKASSNHSPPAPSEDRASGQTKTTGVGEEIRWSNMFCLREIEEPPRKQAAV
jgi:hypothetical protein